MFTVFDLKNSTPLAPDELWAVRRGSFNIPQAHPVFTR